MGVDEYGFGIVVMIVIGCVMVCICYINNCFVGVAFQREEFRARFFGVLSDFVNFFMYVV